MKVFVRTLQLLALTATAMACSGGDSPTDSGSRLSVAMESHALGTSSGTEGVPAVVVTLKNTGSATVGGLLVSVSFMKGNTAVGQAQGAFANPLPSGQSARIEAPYYNIPSYDCYRLSVQGFQQGAGTMQTLLESKGSCQ